MIPLAAVLLASILQAGPETPVSEPARDAQPYVQIVSDTAADADTALVVWSEGHEVRGARVDRAGRTLDAVPLLITYSPWRSARVARGSTGWLVVWADPAGIQAKIVNDDGTQGEAFFLATSPGNVRVAFDGASFLVLWDDYSSRIHGARVSASGQLLEAGIDVAPGGLRSVVDLFPARGGGFVLVVVSADFAALTLDGEGRLVSSRSLLTVPSWSRVTVGMETSGRIVLAWTDHQGTYLKRELGTAVTLPESVAAVEDFMTVGSSTYALVLASGMTSLIRVDGSPAWELPGQAVDARAASFGDRVLIARSNGDVSATVLSASLQTVAPEVLVYAEPPLQFGPAVAQAGGLRLLAWTEVKGDSPAVMARIGEGTPFLVASEGSGVQVATDGRDFLLTWHDEVLRLHAVRILSNGTILEPAQTVNGWTQGASCVSWSGSDYVIGYVAIGSAPRPTGVAGMAQRVTRDGDLSGSPLLLISRIDMHGIDCASTDTTTLFATYGRYGRVEAATLSRGGTASGVIDLGSGTLPSVAAHREGFLVAWPNSYSASLVSWVPVSEGGTPGSPHTIEASSVTAAPRPGGYLLLYGNHPLRARTLDPQGNPTGPEIVIAEDAGGPAFAGRTLAYHRDTDILSEARWRVFLREVEERPARRRTLRH